MANLTATNVATTLTVDSGTNLATAITGATVSNDTITFTRANGGTFAVATSDADTWRPVDDTPVDGNTTTSISSNWAFDNVKTAVPANAVFTDTVNTFDGAYSSLSGLPTLGTAAGRALTDFVSVGGDTMTGNLTISNSAPAIYLTDSNNNPDFKIQNLNGAFNINDETYFQSRLYVGTNFYVGIGNNTNPAEALHVTGNILASGDITAYSDKRLKKNITPLQNALETVKQIQGVSFVKADDEEENTQIGFIAQDLRETLPSVVKEHENGMLSVAYANMVAILTEAIKEQQKQIDELKAKLDGLTK